jgi:hypothetical protein
VGRILRALLAFCCLALFSVGCSKSEDKLAQIQGKVYYHGVPLHGGTIVFVPDADRGGHGPELAAEIRPDGSYSLKGENGQGVNPGCYRVTIAADAADALPERYSDPDKSGEMHEIKPGVVNIVDIRLD